MYCFFIVGLIRDIFGRMIVEQHTPGWRVPIVELMMFYAPEKRAQENGGYGKTGYQQ